MKLFIMRHGQSVGNTKRGFIAGRSDTSGLTTTGRAQIIRSAYALKNKKITAIYASPVIRAQESADILARYYDLPVQTHEWLTELDHGKFEGNYWWEVIHNVPSKWRKKREDYHTAYPGGGESMAQMAKRLWEGLAQFMSSLAPSSQHILVTHQAPIGALVYLLSHGDPADYTSKQQQAFLKHIHALRISNGAYLEATFQKSRLISCRKNQAGKPIKERSNNVSFYTKGMMLHEKSVQAIRQKTVSQHTVYHLTNSSDALLKISHAPDPKAVERQITLYTFLRKNHISAPYIKLYDNSNVFYKGHVYIQDYIKGVSQEQCLNNHSPANKQVLTEVYKQLNRIHSLPVAQVKHFWIPPAPDEFQQWEAFMMCNINLTLHHLDELVLTDKTQEYIASVLNRLKNYVRSNTYTIVPIHGDVSTDNIIIGHDQGKCTFKRLIDFEWARLGDRLWDFAYYSGWLKRESPDSHDLWQAVLAQNLSSFELEVVRQYEILFHAWTVRDMIEYQASSLRLTRGKRSKEILENL